MTQLAAALRRLGLSEQATTVYEVLLRRAPVTTTEVARTLAIDRASVLSAHAELASRGLVHALVSDDDLLSPIPPTAGLDLMAQHLVTGIDESRLAVTTAYEAFRRTNLASSREEVIEVVTGEDIAARLRTSWLTARREIRQFVSPPYVIVPNALADAFSTLERGVRQRVVYSRASLMRPGYLEEVVHPCIERGELVRVVESVPVKLIVIDEDFAMVSPSIRESDVHNTMFVVHPSGLLTAIIGLFDQTWEHALPFAGTEPGTFRLPRADRDLLILLSSGMTDEEVAGRLSISRRTLSRRMEMLMARSGAATRFQLALHARQRGWL